MSLGDTFVGSTCNSVCGSCSHFLTVSGNLLEAVVLPKHEDLNEWLAMNTVDFFNELTVFFEICAEAPTHKNLKMGQG